MLIDTDVMVDILRQHPPAVAWLSGLGTAPVGLPGLVAMELLQGCASMADQQRVEKQIQRFSLYWPTASDCQRALQDFATFRLSHNLGLLDVLIGETAVGVNLPLATFNTKHFSVIPGLKTIQPY